MPRDQIFLTTKVWPDQFRDDGALQRSVKISVQKLRIKPDLVLLRWPNPAVPLAAAIAAPIRIYDLLGTLEDLDDETERVRCGRWEEAYGVYLQREWEVAVEAFGSLTAEDPDDELARMYVGRTERYLTDLPGPDWLGVETYLSK